MSLKNSKMTKSTKEKHGVKKTLRTAVILCAAVAAGVSAGSSGNIAKANGEDYEQCHLDKDCFIVRNSYTADKHFVYLLYFYLITLLT